MQTHQQIQQLLAAAGTSPKKRFGQNFLIDLNLMRLIVATANLLPQEVVLEVGCGTGSLTEALAEQAGHVVAVELDKTLAQIAADRLDRFSNITLLQKDILENKHTLSVDVLSAIDRARREKFGSFLLVANLPYNVASPVMLNLVTGPLPIDRMVVTIQKEVADRMIAPPQCHDYGGLSILLQATGQVELIRRLKPTVFWPPPQVDSAIVRYERQLEKVKMIDDLTLLSDIIGLFMGHRRKMLKAATRSAQASLSHIKDWPALFEQANIDAQQRPDQLTPQQFVCLANVVTQTLESLKSEKSRIP